ncbi:SGNH/GDSL hydrolase family protein, partial [Actinomadura adrarensis]
MALPRLCAITASAVTITAGCIVGAGTASAATVHYVALGDSYSSGSGAGDYDPDSGSCRRSAKAFPKLWAASRSPGSFKFVACAGATTTKVEGQLGALSRRTTLVSLTVGGNDAGFSRVMVDCILGTTGKCENAVKRSERYMRTTLPGRLDSLYDAIRKKAPSAHVVVLGYPRGYIRNSKGCVGLGQTKRRVLNRASDSLNTAIGKAVAEAGFTFSDVRDEFDGHELCSGDDWLNSVRWPIGDSYHPTA